MDMLALVAVSGGLTAAIAAIAAALGAGVALGIKLWVEHVRRSSLQKEIEAERSAARTEAERTIAQAEAQANSEYIKKRQQFDGETEQTRKELHQEERRLSKREDIIDQKMETLNSKERMQEAAEKALSEREKSIAGKDRELDELIAQQKNQLLKLSRLSTDQAREELFSRLRKEMETECAELVEQEVQTAKDRADERAREIILSSIQRYAAEHTCESTVSAVDIPTDDMKGRVIGREGRNIRAFEKATGVDVIVDDTPGVVVVSAFDPVRREIARQSLEKLIQDGRIHPTRIEDVVAGVQKNVNKQIQEAGKQALVEAKIRGVHAKLVELLGRLSYRTSYGQNVLKHSIEVAYLSQLIADELGAKGRVARRCGLLHDIGKAVDHEVEGGHPQIGADLLKRYGERDEVIEACAAHHGDGEASSLYTPIVAAADAISASRPGARRETLERYVQRLQELEAIATSFDGVREAYAIQAGREIRVIVDANNVDDRLSGKIARDIARRIEEEMEYPGEIKVTLVREVRCVEYAQ